MTSPVLLDIAGKCIQQLPGTNRDLVTALRTEWQHLAGGHGIASGAAVTVGGTFLFRELGALGWYQGFQNK